MPDKVNFSIGVDFAGDVIAQRLRPAKCAITNENRAELRRRERKFANVAICNKS
jgi:hypothetical protein